MNLISTPLEQINESHLIALVDASARESYCLEFKKELPSGEDAAEEICKDIAGMANWVGGDIVYGMAEVDKGAASRLFAVGKIEEAPRLLDKWRAVVDSKMAPRVPGLRFTAVKIGQDDFVLIVRVPNSYLSPHAVKINPAKGQLAYWIRTEDHVRPMPEDEVRRRYVSGPDVISRIDRIRYSNVMSDGVTIEGPYYPNSCRVHCLFVPIEGLLYEKNQPYPILKSAIDCLNIEVGGSDVSPCLEGAFKHGGYLDGISFSWCVHRNGMIAWTDAGTNRIWPKPNIIQPEKCVRPKYEKVIGDRIDDVKRAFGSMGISGQIAVCLSLTRTKGAEVYVDMTSGLVSGKCPHDEIHAPAIIVDSVNELSESSLKTSFDLVMNAFGFKASLLKR